MMARLAVLAILTTVATSRGLAQPSLPSAAQAALDAYLEEVVAQTYIPGVVALVTNAERTIYVGAAGYQDVARHRRMREDALFNIASMTKPITSTAVMMFVEAGRISLDDPINEHLRSAVSDEVMVRFDPTTRNHISRATQTSVTIRHLLTHTSGLGYAWAHPTLFALSGNSSIGGSITAWPLLADPGTHWYYGESTRVLGTLVANLANQSLEAFYAEQLFGPLDMRDTGWTVPDRKRGRVVSSHRREGDRLVESPVPDGPIGGPARGDGGLYSTAPDYAKFLRMLLNGGVTETGARLLRAETVALMGQNHIGDLHVELQEIGDQSRSEPFPLGAGRDTFGLGFQITGQHDDAELRAPGSLSWAGIQNTQFWLDPRRGIGAVFLLQYLPFYDATALAALEGFERRVNRNLQSEP